MGIQKIKTQTILHNSKNDKLFKETFHIPNMKEGKIFLSLMILSIFLISVFSIQTVQAQNAPAPPTTSPSATSQSAYETAKKGLEKDVKELKEEIKKLANELGTVNEELDNFEEVNKDAEGTTLYDNALIKLYESLPEIQQQLLDKENTLEEKEKELRNLLGNFIQNEFNTIWNILKYFLIPLVIIILIRFYLLELIADKIPVIKPVAEILKFGGSINTGLWLVLGGAFFYTIQDNKLIISLSNFFKEWLFKLVTILFGIIKFEPNFKNTLIISIIASILIALILALIFKLLDKIISEAFGFRAKAKRTAETGIKGLKTLGAVGEAAEELGK